MRGYREVDSRDILQKSHLLGITGRVRCPHVTPTLGLGGEDVT